MRRDSRAGRLQGAKDKRVQGEARHGVLGGERELQVEDERGKNEWIEITGREASTRQEAEG